MKSDREYILRWAKKIRAVKMLGGECMKCGTSDIFALTFHHINQEDKENKISNLLYGRWDDIEKEIIKCQLLCGNCHQELHFDEEGLNKRHSELKIDLLKYKGVNGCQECGFRGENLSSLEFHHINKKDKSFSIRDVGSSMKEGFDRIAKEADKCSVICKNCHSKKRIDIDKFNKFKDQIYFTSENMQNRKYLQSKIDRNIIIDMYVNKKMKQIDISRKLKCAKSTICEALKECLK